MMVQKQIHRQRLRPFAEHLPAGHVHADHQRPGDGGGAGETPVIGAVPLCQLGVFQNECLFSQGPQATAQGGG